MPDHLIEKLQLGRQSLRMQTFFKTNAEAGGLLSTPAFYVSKRQPSPKPPEAYTSVFSAFEPKPWKFRLSVSKTTLPWEYACTNTGSVRPV